MVMDRFYCMFKFKSATEYECLLEGRRMAAVISAGGDENDGADLVTEICRRIAQFSKAEWLGAFVAANVTSVEAIRENAELTAQARTFGQKLAS